MVEEKSWYKKTMRGDAVAFFVVPIIFLILTMVTSVIIITWQASSIILNQTFTQFGIAKGAPCASIQNCTQIPTNIGKNIYSFDNYLPFIFYMMMIAIIISAVLLSPDPLSWLIGIIYLPLIYFVSVYISNAAHGILAQPVLATGVVHLPASLLILANLPTITFLFGLIYIVMLSARVYVSGFQLGQGAGSGGYGGVKGAGGGRDVFR